MNKYALKTLTYIHFVVFALCLLIAYAGCSSGSGNHKRHSTNGDLTPDDVDNKIEILPSYNLLTIGAKKWRSSTNKELADQLSAAAKEIRKDTLFVFMEDNNTDRLDSVAIVIFKLQIKLFQFIITKGFFVLPFPPQST